MRGCKASFRLASPEATSPRCQVLNYFFDSGQVTRLCESPFISQAFRNQERAERILELEQGGRAAQLKIDHLQVSLG